MGSLAKWLSVRLQIMWLWVRVQLRERGCLQNFLSLFMSLLTALIVKKSHILVLVYIIFLEKHRILNLKGFQYQIWTSVKKLGKYL